MNFSGLNLSESDNGKYLSELFSRRKSNRSGTMFFGIDRQYLAKVQKKEIFELVNHGFSYESLMKMSIEERRYYYHLLIEKHNPKKPENQPSSKKGKEMIKFNPLG